MTREEYIGLFHKEQLNLVAFRPLFHCDDEVLRLVNAAIAAEREACAKLIEQAGIDGMGTLAAAAMIRNRDEK